MVAERALDAAGTETVLHAVSIARSWEEAMQLRTRFLKLSSVGRVSDAASKLPEQPSGSTMQMLQSLQQQDAFGTSVEFVGLENFHYFLTDAGFMPGMTNTLILVGSVLLLYTPTAMIGALMLILFTLTADALFHRFWTYADPHEAVIHKFFLIEHIALCGGILGLAAATL